jgi:hypothetical protein
VRRTGQTAGERRRRLPEVAAVALAALLPGPGMAQDALVGVWEISVLDGPEQGDIGQIAIRQTADGLAGDMVFTDVKDGVSATESCRVWSGTPTIQIYCTVLTVDPTRFSPSYFPDNFVVRLVAPDLMEGLIVSATTGNATLTRRESPSS